MVNKFRSPNKVTTDQVAKYLSNHRMVFVMQISIEKLYELKSSIPFNIAPVLTYANAVSEPIYEPIGGRKNLHLDLGYSRHDQNAAVNEIRNLVNNIPTNVPPVVNNKIHDSKN